MRYKTKRYKSDSPKWQQAWLKVLEYDEDGDPYSVFRLLSYKIRRVGDNITSHDTFVGAEKIKPQTDIVADLLVSGPIYAPYVPLPDAKGIPLKKKEAWLKILSKDADYDWALILEILIQRLRRFRKARKSTTISEHVKRIEVLLKRVMDEAYFSEMCKNNKPAKPTTRIDEKGRRVTSFTDENVNAVRPLLEAAETAKIEDLRLALELLCGIFYLCGIELPSNVQKNLESACKLMTQNIFGWWD